MQHSPNSPVGGELLRTEEGEQEHQALLEQIGVCSCAHEHYQAMFSAVIELLRQKKVAANMAFPMPFPVPTQWMIEPLWAERSIVGDQQQHCLLEPVHVVPTCSRQPLPIL